jgi:hypothetical protein
MVVGHGLSGVLGNVAASNPPAGADGAERIAATLSGDRYRVAHGHQAITRVAMACEWNRATWTLPVQPWAIRLSQGETRTVLGP